MKYIVYQTTNLINGKIYIGVHKTKNPDIFDSYLGCGVKINMPSSYSNPSSPFQYAVKKYGVKNFKRITLAVFDTAKEALKLEEELVTYEFIKRPDTYNVQLGGKTGYKYYPINQFDLDGNYLKTWNTMAEAAEFYCVSHTAILNAVNFKGSCKKYYWSKENSINITEFTSDWGTPCYQYDATTGKCIGFFNTLKEAAFFVGVNPTSISAGVSAGYKIKECYFSNKLLEEYFGKKKVSIKNKPLYVYNLEGEYLVTLYNGKEIKEYFNINTTNTITAAIRKEVPYKTYQFSLEKVDRMPKHVKKTHFKRAVLVYDLIGNFVEELESIKLAKEKYSGGVIKVLNGAQQQCRGFIFKYKDEVNDIV